MMFGQKKATRRAANILGHGFGEELDEHALITEP